MQHYSTNDHVINAKTATYTSDPVHLEGASKVILTLKRSNHSAGSSAFSAEVSIDGSVWIPYRKWIDNLADTNAESETRVQTKTLNSNSDASLTMDPADTCNWMRVTVTETTDGTHDAWIYAEYNC